MFDANEYLSPSQAARALKVSEAAVRLWVKRGVLSAVRTAIGHLIPRQEVERLAEERRKRQQQGK